MAWCWFNATESKPQNVTINFRKELMNRIKYFENTLLSNERIIKIDININDDIIFISVDKTCKLHIKKFSLKSNKIESAFPVDNFYVEPLNTDLFNDFNTHYFKHELPNTNVEQIEVISVKDFQSLTNDCFYLNLSGKENYHVKINLKGEIINKSINDIESKYKYSTERDFVFFDIENFEEYPLFEYFDSVLEYDEFWYNRIMDHYVYSLFFSTDKKKIGLFYFNKDYDSPRGNYSFFDARDLKNLKLLATYRVDEPHSNHKFKINDNNTIYFYNPYKDVFAISNLENNSIIEISNNFKLELFGYKDFFMISNKMIKVYYDRFVVFDSISETNIQIKRVINSPYSFNENKLIYVNDGKLKLIEFE